MSVKLGTDLFQPEASDEIALWLADEFTQVRTKDTIGHPFG